MSFSGDIKKFNQKTGKNIDTVVKKVAFDLSRELIMGTPVQDGTARRNWFVSMNSPIVRVTSDTDKNGGKTIRDAQVAVQGYSSGDDVWITNSVPYILRLENGWSAQRPNGWVSRSVRKFQRILRKAASQL